MVRTLVKRLDDIWERFETIWRVSWGYKRGCIRIGDITFERVSHFDRPWEHKRRRGTSYFLVVMVVTLVVVHYQ